MKARTISSIMRHVASRLPTLDPDAEVDGASAVAETKKDQDKEGADGVVPPPTGPSEEERLEKLYEQVAWPLGRKYGNVYDAFKLSLTQVFSPDFRYLTPHSSFRYLVQRTGCGVLDSAACAASDA